jgi:hypothetical protein
MEGYAINLAIPRVCNGILSNFLIITLLTERTPSSPLDDNAYFIDIHPGALIFRDRLCRGHDHRVESMQRGWLVEHCLIWMLPLVDMAIDIDCRTRHCCHYGDC